MKLLSKLFSPRSISNDDLFETALNSSNFSIAEIALNTPNLSDLIDSTIDQTSLKRALKFSHIYDDKIWTNQITTRRYSLNRDEFVVLDYIQSLLSSEKYKQAKDIFDEHQDRFTTNSYRYNVQFWVSVRNQDFENIEDLIYNPKTYSKIKNISSLREQYIHQLAANGNFKRARAELANFISDPQINRDFINASTSLTLAFDGVDAALSELECEANRYDGHSSAFVETKANLLFLKGRYNQAFEMLKVYLENSPLSYHLLPITDIVANHSDRDEELRSIINKARTISPANKQLLNFATNWEIAHENYKESSDLITQLGRFSTTDKIIAEFNRYCHQPDLTAIQTRFDQLTADGISSVGETLLLSNYLYYFQAGRGGIQLANDLLSQVFETRKNDVSTIALRLRLDIAKGDVELARKRLLETPPGFLTTAELKPFELYFQNLDQDIQVVKDGWKKHLNSTLPMVLNARSSYPVQISQNFKPKKSDVLLFATIYNGREFAEKFIDYYRSIGVNHFFIIDNNSTDGSFEFFQKQKDVSLFYNADSFSASACGMFWINHLMRKFGDGHWCLHVDMDEFFVFPMQDEGKTLSDLLIYMDRNGYESIPSIMLDIYPESLGVQSEGDQFTNSKYIDTDYYFIDSELPPYKFIQGGIRARLSGKSLLMTKAPLIKMHPNFAYLANNHNHTALKMSDVTSVLLHYKFIGNFDQRIDDAIERKEHFMGARFYRALKLGTDGSKTLLSEHSVEYENQSQLIQIGLMKKGKWGL